MLPLESCELFNSLGPADVATLMRVTREISFPAGAEIFKEGDAGDALYAIRSGAVQICGVVADGHRQVFSRLPARDVFGEIAVGDNQPRSAGAVAEANTVVYRVPREALIELLQRSPQFSFSMMREIAGRLREFNREHIQIVLPAERMALIGRFASSIVHALKTPLT